MSNAKTKIKLWPSVKTWLSDIKLQKEPEDHSQVVQSWFQSFLESPDADDRDTRLEVLALYTEIQKLFKILSGATPEEFDETIEGLKEV